MKRAILLLSTLALFAGIGLAAAEEVDPWAALKTVRQSLVDAGPTGASFTQTYVPSGFSSGEKESGKLALALPDCLRWDYTAPYPKSFLICGGVLHAWNEEDKTGRRYRVDRKNEPGLDLLLLGVDELKERYRANGRTVAGGKVEIALFPKEAKGDKADKAKTAELTDATLTVDPATKRVTGIAYHDREGNLTRFDIADYQDLPRQGRFTPPAGIKWEEQ
ncbi:MAG TPA: outer membrane lipoprotein carrier protein LolA [Thermoanaerobaculia bacterium]|jgi:outer membrane lipoprotein-sorting protein|nr:outer membrane lipoprotein carrier protein LolA [Thermoanaerobaculia bacterium]